MKKTTLDACALLIRPIASVLLRFGITWKEFSELSKLVFVQVATEEYGIKGRPTNASRVEIMTGVNRREVAQLRKKDMSIDLESLHKHSMRGALLSGWANDKDFCDENNNPLRLIREGVFPSFTDLVKRYGKDISTHAVLKELIAFKSIEEDSDGFLKLVNRKQIVGNSVDDQLYNFCIALADCANTSKDNYLTDNLKERKLCGYADEMLPIELVPKFKELVSVKGMEFLEEIDTWLMKNRIDENDNSTEAIRLGAGAYMIHDRSEGFGK